MPSFDVVSKVDKQEVDNAFQQTKKELAQRYDFKGTDTTIEHTQEGLVLRSSTEDRIKAAYEVLVERADVGCNLFRARQKARAHGNKRTLNVIINGLRLLAHLCLAVPDVRDPTNLPAGGSKYNRRPLARLASQAS